jgi:hypothetical protein
LSAFLTDNEFWKLVGDIRFRMGDQGSRFLHS